jgi:hypothetical protein
LRVERSDHEGDGGERVFQNESVDEAWWRWGGRKGGREERRLLELIEEEDSRCSTE